MRVILLVAVLAAVVSAVPHADHHHKAAGGSGGHDYQPPGAAKRSPCPGLNTLANYGWLPRDGMNITKPMLIDAIQNGFGTSSIFATLFADAAHPKFANGGPTFSFPDLHRRLEDNPSGVEHRASLSRLDKTKQPDQSKPDKERVEFVLANCSKDKKKFTYEDLADCRSKLNDLTLKEDPAYTSSPMWSKAKIIGFLEANLALNVFKGGNQPDGLPLDYMKSFLLDEKFPAGWQKLNNWGVTEFIGSVIKSKGYAVGKSWIGWIQDVGAEIMQAPKVLARLFGAD